MDYMIVKSKFPIGCISFITGADEKFEKK